MKSQEDRKLNLIIHNIPESTSEEFEDRQEHDMEYVERLLSDHLKLKNCSPVSVRRLGSKQRDSARTRTLMVHMKTEEDKRRALFSTRKLRDAPQPFNRFSLAEDMSPDQVEQHKSKVEEAKKRNQEETSRDYINLVRGAAGRRHIVRVPRRHQ